MNSAHGRHPLSPDTSSPNTSPADPRRSLEHSDAGQWPRQSPRDSSAILLSQSIARISDDELKRMNRDDLIDVARCASFSLPRPESLGRLPYMTRDQLQQVAFLARRSCRLQTQPGVPLR